MPRLGLRQDRADSSSQPPPRARSPLWTRPGAELDAFSYDDILPFVYLPLAPEHQIAQRAYEAVCDSYDLDRNPDLTHRYGNAGFQPGTQALYYYYLVVARALSTRGSPWIELADGRRVDWVRDLSRRLLRLQRQDGSWVNGDATWWEDEPVLVTSYALLTLSLCLDVPAAAPPK